MLIGDLTIRQKIQIEEMKSTYGNSSYLATEGSASLLDAFDEAKNTDDILDIIFLEVNFYKDIPAQCLGELMHILLKDQTKL